MTMSKLLIFSDIHRDWRALGEIIKEKADIYICLGDLSSWGDGLDRAGEILASLGERLWLFPGNHETESQIQTLCLQYGFTDFHKKINKLEKYHLAGFGLCSPTPFGTPGEVGEEEIAKSLDKFKGLKNLILFTHVPPKNTSLDKTSSGAYAGSLVVRKFIEERRPLYCFSGHVHENEGKKEKLGKTTCFSVGKKGIEFLL